MLKLNLADSICAALGDIACVALAPQCPRVVAKGFLLSYETFRLSPADVRCRIATDPRVVSTVDNLQRMLAEIGIEFLKNPLWAGYLSSLASIGVGAAILARTSFSIELESAERSGFAIPGTNIMLMPADGSFPDSSRSVSLTCMNGELILRPNCGWDRCMSEHSELILARPEPALTPPRACEKLLSGAEIEERNWEGAIDGAYRLLRLHDASWQLVRDFGNLVVPIRNEKSDLLSSVSFDSHPGAIFTSWCEDFHMLAETLVHESDHQRHYLLTRQHAFWLGPEDEQAPIFRSPWRDDPRPLDGILRGASAFASVGAFWTAVLDNHNNPTAWIGRRAVFANYQAIDALMTLRKFADLTCDGQLLLEELCSSVVETRTELRRSRKFLEWVDYAYEEQAAHDIRWRIGASAKTVDAGESIDPQIYFDFTCSANIQS